MPLPLLLVPVVISAIKSLIRFRDRVDDILTLHTVTDGLPFGLPPAPPNIAEFQVAMLTFFETPPGQLLLEVQAMKGSLSRVKAAPKSEAVFSDRKALFSLYCQVAGIGNTTVGPQEGSLMAKGLTPELRLAAFVVQSHRLSRNPPLTRMLLAATDTLLEFGAENAGLFVNDRRTRVILETLLTEFAVKRDWDDETGAQIFKTLLGSAAASFAIHGAEFSNQPAVAAFFGALADVREEVGDEFFVDRFISRDSLSQLTQFFLVRVADTPGLLPPNEIARDVVGTLLREASKNFDSILDDPKAIVGVLESGLGAAATHADVLIGRKLGNRPLLAAVFTALAVKVKEAADQNELVAEITRGEFFGLLYETALRAVAARPDLLGSDAKLGALAGNLVASVAGLLADSGLSGSFTPATLQRMALSMMETLAESSEMLASNHDFLGRVLGAVLPAAVKAAQDGFTVDDLEEISSAALEAVAGNLGMVELDDQLKAVVESVSSVLTDANLKALLTTSGRKEVFLATLDAVVANPRIWAKLAGDGPNSSALVLVQKVFAALSSDPTRLLTGPSMAEAARLILLAAARRGQRLLDGSTTPDDLAIVLTAALKRAEKSLGNGMDGETLPEFLQHVVDGFLTAPFATSDLVALSQLLDEEMPLPDSSLLLDAFETRALHPLPRTGHASRKTPGKKSTR